MPPSNRSKSFTASMTLGSTMPTRSEQPNREERVRRYGINCADSVQWKDWSPGGEYCKSVEIRNTLHTTQVIEYTLPKNKSIYFLEFPQPVTLAPGLAYKLEIRFRPLDLQDYSDAIQVRTNRGSFWLFFESKIPYIDLELDEKLDFAFCPVKEIAERPITIRNTGTTQFEYTWLAEPPFSYVPSKGKLAPGASTTTKVQFLPKEASVYVASAICKVDENHSKRMKVSGIGKYPFIATSTQDIEFGNVICGKDATATVHLMNKSLVPARYTITKVDYDLEKCFTFTPMKGEVGPESKKPLTVKFKPLTSGVFSCDTYKISTVGGNSVTIRLTGHATGPETTASVTSLNFGDLEEGESATKTFKLSNHSPVPAHYEWFGCGNGGVFCLDKPSGVVPPCDKLHKGQAVITVKFSPVQSLNYYRRVFCQINTQSTLLHLDLLGTGFNEKEKKRPAPFTQKQVDIYRLRLEAGLGKLAPEDIEKMLDAVENGEEAGDVEENNVRDMLVTTMSTISPAPKLKDLWKEMFQSVTDSVQLAFSLDEEELNFGQATRVRGGDVQPIHVRNNTGTKATVVWSLPHSPGQVPIFDVHPISSDVKAYSSQTFKVIFRPPSDVRRFFHERLECYAFFKTMRSFRLVHDRSFTPPVCLSLPVHGHTFGYGEAFAPNASLSKSTITFPACHPTETIYQTLMIVNHAETPSHFEVALDPASSKAEEEAKRRRAAREQQDFLMDDDSVLESTISSNNAPDGSRVFSCQPSAGVLPPGGFQILAFRFQPQTATQYQGMGRVRLNDTSTTLPIRLFGQSFIPSLVLTDDASLFFKPTHVGSSSSRMYAMENPSRIPITFSWNLRDAHRNAIQIEPPAGILRGNERVKVKVTFSPTQEKKYLLRIPCECTTESAEGNEGGSKTRAVLAVVGEGIVGGITMEPGSLDFGTVRIGSNETRQLTLFNTSSGDVPYELEYKLSKEVEDTGKLMTFSKPKGTIPGRAHSTINVVFNPVDRRTCNATIYCKLPQRTKELAKLATMSGPPGSPSSPESIAEDLLSVLPRCEAAGVGAYPTLQITDVRAMRTSKAHLWEQFSINAINEAILAEITADDENNTEFSVKRLIEKAPPFTIDFASGVIDSYPNVVHVHLSNTGKMPVQFSFRSPQDSDLDAEQWWPDEVITHEDRVIEYILDNRFFDISPKDGEIPVGGGTTIRFSYQYKSQGVHRLPILMSIKNGKRVCLNLLGRTLEPNEKHLHFTSNTHKFQPISIGERDTPLQYYELRNTSTEPVPYKVDDMCIEKVTEENYKFPIFQCHNPEGIIPAQDSVFLRWSFTPLEPKTYQLQCPIHVANDEGYAESYEVDFSAMGYHSKKITAEELKDIQATEFADLVSSPDMIVDAMPVRLSMDVLNFGRVAYHSVHRRFVVVTNHSTTDTQSFIWNTQLPYGNARIVAEPAKGSLEPGEKVVCKITFHCGSTSQILDMNIDCIVLNTTLRAKREEERKQWEAGELSMATASDDTFGHHMSWSGTTRGRSFNPDKPTKKWQSVTETHYGKSQNIFGMQRANIIAEEDENKGAPGALIWVDVKPVFLGVRIQARVMNIEQYKEWHMDQVQSCFFSDLCKHQEYQDTPFPETGVPPKEMFPSRPGSAKNIAGALLEATADLNVFEAEMLNTKYQEAIAWQEDTRDLANETQGKAPIPDMTKDQADLYSSIFSDLLREIINHPDVTEAYNNLHTERVPYYCEVVGTPKNPKPQQNTFRTSISGASEHSAKEDPVPAETSILHRPESAVSFKDPISAEIASELVVQAQSLAHVPAPPAGGSPAQPQSPSTEQLAMVAEAEGKKQYLQALKEARLKEAEAVERRRVLQSGAFQVALEGVLEDTLFQILADAALTNQPIVQANTTQKLNRRKKLADAMSNSTLTPTRMSP